VINTFRYDDGRLAEEWVQTDYRSFLTKLGVTTTESAQQGTHTQTVRDLITHFFNAHDPEVAPTYFTERTSGGRAARSAPSRDATHINR